MMAKKPDDYDELNTPDKEQGGDQEYGLENIEGMSEEKDPDWISGYQASDLADAESPNYPGNQVWQGVGASAETYKKDWKNMPPLFPYGRNREGGK